MNKKAVILLVGPAFLVGVLTASVVVRMNSKSHFNWLETSIEKKHFGVSYSTKALFGSDIPLPKIKKITGKIKFVKRSNDGASVNLGYLANISQENLDKSNIPKKYLKQRPVIIEGQKVILEPIDEVVYEVMFNFVLKDKDGFEVLEVASKPETIYSGKKNELQGIIQQQIPIELVSRVVHVQMETQVTKCVTCE